MATRRKRAKTTARKRAAMQQNRRSERGEGGVSDQTRQMGTPERPPLWRRRGASRKAAEAAVVARGRRTLGTDVIDVVAVLISRLSTSRAWSVDVESALASCSRSTASSSVSFRISSSAESVGPSFLSFSSFLAPASTFLASTSMATASSSFLSAIVGRCRVREPFKNNLFKKTLVSSREFNWRPLGPLKRPLC